MGESLAVRVSDVNFEDKVVTINKAYSRDRLETPKDGESRETDLSEQLVDVPRKMIVSRRRQCFAAGKPMPALLFPTRDGRVMNKTHVWRAMVRTLKNAGLSTREISEDEESNSIEDKFTDRFSPHSFRHTFASRSLQAGVSPACVQRQLDHSSIKMTVDTYGKWLPAGNKEAINKLDETLPTVPAQESQK